jgi:hypothetical protein
MAGVPSVPGVPKAPSKPQPDAIPSDALTARIDNFLASRGLAPQASQVSRPAEAPQTPSAKASEPEKFVCEDDVRLAVKEGRKLLIGERTIVTPAARDAGEAAKVFIHAGWPSS